MNNYFRVGGGVSLGMLSPDGYLDRTRAYRYKGMKMPIHTYSEDEVDALLIDGSLTNQLVKEQFSVKLNNGNYGIAKGYEIFVVVSVALTAHIDLEATGGTGLVLANGTAPMACKEPAPLSQVDTKNPKLPRT